MTTNLVLKKLRLDEKEFVSSKEIKMLGDKLNYNSKNLINNLTYRGYLLRLFKGIFYVKTFDEIKLSKLNHSYLELTSSGLKLRGITNWYFGLYTALKLNTTTHEYFAVDYVINDTLFRPKPITIADHKIKFVKVNSKLFNFGIEKNNINYSDLEKTILDFIYLWRYNGRTKEKILMDISEYTTRVSKTKIREYSEHYPKSVKKILDELI